MVITTSRIAFKPEARELQAPASKKMMSSLINTYCKLPN